MMIHDKILIVGGGVIGLTAAIAMKTRGYDVTVLERAQIDDFVSTGRVYALNEASKQLLQVYNIWQELEKDDLSPYIYMEVWDLLSQGRIKFDARLVQKDRLGTIIPESALKQTLLKQARALAIHIHETVVITKIVSSKECVRLYAEKQMWTGAFLMIADGAHSCARSLLQVPMTTWSYHQNAIVAPVYMEKSHQKTAFQVFLPDGPLAILPLHNEHYGSIVWSCRASYAKHLMSLSDKDFERKLTQAIEKKLGNVSIMGERHGFPLQMRHTKQYSGENWIMMGDAAHTVHPLAGLGLNIGLADLSTWINLLDTNQDHCSRKMQATYHRQRQQAVWQQITMLQMIKTLFSNSSTPLAWLRGLGLDACDNISLLKRFFIEQANA